MHVPLQFLQACFLLTTILQVEGRYEMVTQTPLAEDSGFQYAYVIVDSGLRSPLNLISQTQDDFNTAWPEGQGALTSNGVEMMQKIGQTLKLRYGKVISPWTPDKFTVTTAFDKPWVTKSRESIVTEMGLTGLTSSVDPLDKISLLENADSCARYKNILQSIVGDEISKLPQALKDDLQEINRVLTAQGYITSDITTLDDVYKFYDRFLMEELDEKTVKDEVKSIIPRMRLLVHFRLWSRLDGKNYDNVHHSILEYFTAQQLDQIKEDTTGATKLRLHVSEEAGANGMLWSLVQDSNSRMLEAGDAFVFEIYTNEIKLFMISVTTGHISPLSAGEDDNGLRKILCQGTVCSPANFKDLVHQIGYKAATWQEKCQMTAAYTAPPWKVFPLSQQA